MSKDYSSPVSQLLTFGDCRGFGEWPNYLDLGLGPEHADELIEMATDEELNWADPDDLGIWAPVHAWRALGQLRATVAIEPLLHLFHELEDNDWASDELPVVYGMIGREAIPALSRYLEDERFGLYPHIAAAGGLKQIGLTDPSARAACVEALSRSLERFGDNDPSLLKIRTRWEQALRQAVLKLPDIRFKVQPDTSAGADGETIELVDGNDPATVDLQPQQTQQRTQGRLDETRR